MGTSKSVGILKGNERFEPEADEFDQTPSKPIKLPKQRSKIKNFTDGKSSLVLKQPTNEL